MTLSQSIGRVRDLVVLEKLFLNSSRKRIFTSFVVSRVCPAFVKKNLTCNGWSLPKRQQDPLDLSFWSFLTFLHHGIDKVR